MKTQILDRWLPKLERALALLADRLDEPLTLDEFAAAAAISPFHFHRIWRSLLGETVGQTIARLRIVASQQRMQADGGSITAIAVESGFATPQSFARAFRRITGMSPSAFLADGSGAIVVAPPADAAVRIELRGGVELVALRREGGGYHQLNALFQRVWDWADAGGHLGAL